MPRRFVWNLDTSLASQEITSDQAASCSRLGHDAAGTIRGEPSHLIKSPPRSAYFTVPLNVVEELMAEDAVSVPVRVKV